MTMLPVFGRRHREENEACTVGWGGFGGVLGGKKYATVAADRDKTNLEEKTAEVRVRRQMATDRSLISTESSQPPDPIPRRFDRPRRRAALQRKRQPSIPRRLYTCRSWLGNRQSPRKDRIRASSF
jgi:hypothetical protein